jgi:hypothetical protein
MNMKFGKWNFVIAVSIASLCFTALSHSEAQAQGGIAAFNDYKDAFIVFDRGSFQQLDHMKVRSFKPGGTTLAYVDNSGEFQIYYNGKKYHQLYSTDMFSYFNTNYLVAYKVAQVLYVFEKGKSQIVSYYCNDYYLGDSILAYYDETEYNLGIYYKGSKMPIESSLLSAPKTVRVGSNLVAYVNQSGYFKIYYNGELKDVDNTTPVSFESGRDIVAYVDGYQKYFHLFYKGQLAQVDVNLPESYKVGFGNMAYIDYDVNFRVFSNGATRRLISQRPDFYEVKGNMIIYGYNSEFRAFANGESQLIDDIMPKEYKLSNDGVAYLDINGMLKFYYQGKTNMVSHETPTKYFIYNDVVLYLLGTNTWKVWWNGTNY